MFTLASGGNMGLIEILSPLFSFVAILLVRDRGIGTYFVPFGFALLFVFVYWICLGNMQKFDTRPDWIKNETKVFPQSRWSLRLGYIDDFLWNNKK